jgi:hypothetical protein
VYTISAIESIASWRFLDFIVDKCGKLVKILESLAILFEIYYSLSKMKLLPKNQQTKQLSTINLKMPDGRARPASPYEKQPMASLYSYLE